MQWSGSHQSTPIPSGITVRVIKKGPEYATQNVQANAVTCISIVLIEGLSFLCARVEGCRVCHQIAGFRLQVRGRGVQYSRSDGVRSIRDFRKHG